VIRIFHTADLHIGMKFNSYPEDVKQLLQKARIEVIENMVKLANDENCNIFVVAGDLFDRINGIDKKTISKTVSALEQFQGDCVIVLPGNHDYDNGMVDLWTNFNKETTDKILYINEEVPYSLNDYGINAIIYPAPCHQKHSNENNLGWIKEEDIDKNYINIGVGHGAIIGLSPDLDSTYYNMSLDELENTMMDMWLLGHTHVVYPFQENVVSERIFNSGTPEPDGLDCKHQGSAWVIDLDDNKGIKAKSVITGRYRFIDRKYDVNDRDDLEDIMKDIIDDNSKHTIARINVSGRVEEDTYNYRQDIFQNISKEILYLIIEDNDLGIKITTEKIHKEFSDGSFPQQLLLSLSDDEDTLQLAYELIMEVKQ